MFQIFKCTSLRKSDLGLCMSSVLANRMPLRSADFQRILRLGNTPSKIGIRHCAAAFILEALPNSCTDLDPTLLYISI